MDLRPEGPGLLSQHGYGAHARDDGADDDGALLAQALIPAPALALALMLVLALVLVLALALALALMLAPIEQRRW